MKKPIIDFLIDYETAGSAFGKINESAVLDLAVIPFVLDPENLPVPNFNELVNSALHIKFDLRSQKAIRIIDADTLAWWKTQPPEAQKILRPTPDDISVAEGHAQVLKFMEESGMTRQSQLWCRGQDFDIPILHNCMMLAGVTKDNFIPFWKSRDVRTRIEAFLGRDVTNCPIPKEALQGFVKHNSVHDCAKDILSMYYSYRYVYGLEEVPEKDNIFDEKLGK